MGVADTRVVGLESRDQDISFPLVEALGTDRIRRENEDENYSPNDGQGAGEVVHISPRGYSSVDLTESVVDDRGDDGDVTSARVPDTHAHCLFILFIETSLERISR